MTYMEAVASYNEMSVAKPGDYLFDGKENIMGRMEAVYEAFGIVYEEHKPVCVACVHVPDCPLKAAPWEDYIECNFYGEER